MTALQPLPKKDKKKLQKRQSLTCSYLLKLKTKSLLVRDSEGRQNYLKIIMRRSIHFAILYSSSPSYAILKYELKKLHDSL